MAVMLDVKKAPLLTLRQVDNADIGLLLAALAIIYSVLLLSTLFGSTAAMVMMVHGFWR
jgi:hypothetical protein